MKCTLNHYHVSAPDKFELASWYQQNFGFEIVTDIEALGEKNGPILISADGGRSGISIFSKGDRDRSYALPGVPAFEVAPDDFVQLYSERLKVSPDLVVYDHLVSLSIYVIDPVGTKIEFVCNDHQSLRPRLSSLKIPVKTMNPSNDSHYREMK
jgi:hypothetical protein